MKTQTSSESNIITIDVQKAKNLIRNDEYRYIDVRTEEEFMKGHIDLDDVLNIPYMIDTPQGRVKNGKFMEQVMQLCDKEGHLIVGCQSGVRSLYAANILLQAGFKHVCNMGGGYLAWVENDIPVTVTTSNVEL
ncbi:rhodanese-like domain-containing protein 17 [Rutidosis leptorrhynchoides]|uniref:rhodanese-like domain-containing protein 17 n=1 Tax=Rutidosis leptorrhynchoides TaxID=125765 RepID=UPI003A99E5F7